MAELSQAEAGLVQRYMDALTEEILTLGLQPQREYDFDDFGRARGSVEPSWIYPTYDPSMNDIRKDAVWLRVLNPAGETVAMTAARVFRADNFYELLETEQLWFGRPTNRDRCTIGAGDPLPAIGGAVGHGGGLWVHPAWRKVGLSRLVPRLNHAYLLRLFSIDHHTTLVFEGLAKSGLPLWGYGFARLPKLIDGFFPPTGKEESVYLGHITRQEMLESMENELAGRATVAVAS